MATAYPMDLTTSDWVDCLAHKSRDEQIAILATFHRRVALDASHTALSTLLPEDAETATLNRADIDAVRQTLQAGPLAQDYRER